MRNLVLAILLSVAVLGSAKAEEAAWFQNQMAICEYWAADPRRAAERPVAITEIVEVRLRKAGVIHASTVVDGEILSGTVEFLRSETGDQILGSVVLARTAAPSDAGPYRVPANIRAIFVAQGSDEKLDFVTGYIDKARRVFKGRTRTMEGNIDCVEVPGESILLAPDFVIPSPRTDDVAVADPVPGTDKTDGGWGNWADPVQPHSGGLSELAADQIRREEERLAAARDLSQREADAAAAARLAAGDIGGDVFEAPLPEPGLPVALATSLCTPEGVDIGQIAVPPGENGPFFAGVRNEETEVPLYEVSSVLDEQAATGAKGRATSPAGAVDLLVVGDAPTLAAPGASDGKLLLVRPLQGEGLTLAATETPTISGAPVNILVFGDPRMLAISGLAVLDDLLATSDVPLGLRVHWHAIGADGEVASPGEFASFAALVAAATNLSSTAPEVRYLERPVFDAVTTGILQGIIGTIEPVDLVLWVMKGSQLPASAPLAIENLLAKVNSDGQVPRFDDAAKRPRKWLYILSGSFATEFSASYIAGPLQSVAPSVGVLEIASADRSLTGPLMSDPGPVLTQLAGNLRSRSIGDRATAATDSPVSYSAEANLHYPAGAAYAQLGVVLSTDQILPLLTSSVAGMALLRKNAPELAAPPFDAISLWSLSTTESGRIEGFEFAASAQAAKEERVRKGGNLDALNSFLIALSTGLTAAAQKPPPVESCPWVFVDLGTIGPLWAH